MQTEIKTVTKPKQTTRNGIKSEEVASVVLNYTSSTETKDSLSPIVLIQKSDLPVLQEDPSYLEALTYVKELKKIKSRWESTLYKASNDALYLILRECYVLLLKTEMYDIESSIRRCIEDECKKGMKKMQKNTTLEAKIVRVIFDDMYNRQRVYRYSIVLQEAKRQKVTADSLADWIKLYGGVQEIRLNAKLNANVPLPKTSKKPLTKEQLKEIADQKEEQKKQAEAAFERLIDTGVFAYDDLAAENKTLDSKQAESVAADAISKQDVVGAEEASACAKKAEENVTSAQVASSGNSSADAFDEDSDTDKKGPNTSVDINKERVCIAYMRQDGTYDVKWELEDDDAREIAIAAYRMEKHGVYSEYEQIKAALSQSGSKALVH